MNSQQDTAGRVFAMLKDECCIGKFYTMEKALNDLKTGDGFIVDCVNKAGGFDYTALVTKSTDGRWATIEAYKGKNGRAGIRHLIAWCIDQGIEQLSMQYSRRTIYKFLKKNYPLVWATGHFISMTHSLRIVLQNVEKGIVFGRR